MKKYPSHGKQTLKSYLHLIGVLGGSRNWKRRNNHRDNRKHEGRSVQAESWAASQTQRCVRRQVLANIHLPFCPWCFFLHLCSEDDQKYTASESLWKDVAQLRGSGCDNSSVSPFSSPCKSQQLPDFPFLPYSRVETKYSVKGTKEENKKFL